MSTQSILADIERLVEDTEMEICTTPYFNPNDPDNEYVDADTEDKLEALYACLVNDDFGDTWEQRTKDIVRAVIEGDQS